MPDDDLDVLPPDPLLASSEGDEAPALLGENARKKWLGVAAGVGGGSAAVAAAVMFWGKKERTRKPAAASVRKTAPRHTPSQRLQTSRTRNMSDDKSNRGPADRSRIDLNEDYEVAYWTKELGVAKAKLEDAVRAVGSSAEKVREHLKAR